MESTKNLRAMLLTAALALTPPAFANDEAGWLVISSKDASKPFNIDIATNPSGKGAILKLTGPSAKRSEISAGATLMQGRLEMNGVKETPKIQNKYDSGQAQFILTYEKTDNATLLNALDRTRYITGSQHAKGIEALNETAQKADLNPHP
jgi:hypothetical protein